MLCWGYNHSSLRHKAQPKLFPPLRGRGQLEVTCWTTSGVFRERANFAASGSEHPHHGCEATLVPGVLEPRVHKYGVINCYTLALLSISHTYPITRLVLQWSTTMTPP
jgi:hypothetical protein